MEKIIRSKNEPLNGKLLTMFMEESSCYITVAF